MTKEEALKTISDKTAQAKALIAECESIAKINKVVFAFKLAYGMGGTFCEGDEYEGTEGEWGWQASSNSC